jgi:YggT family protein
MLITFLDILITAYIILIVGHVLLSWFNYQGPLRDFVDSLTEPVLTPARRLVPSAGGLDFSPTLVVLGLILLQQLIHDSLGR